MAGPIFTAFKQTTMLEPTEITLGDLKKLYNELLEVNRKAIDAETAHRISTKEFKLEPVQQELPDLGEKEEKKQLVTMPFRVEIEGAKGEYYSSIDSTIFDLVNLPSEITQIRFDNSFWCNEINKYFPMRQFNITLDFTSGSPFNIGKSSSQKTQNLSSVSIWGIDQVWVNGSSKIIVDLLQKKKNISRHLHAGLAYDLILWFIFLPLLVWNYSKLDFQIKSACPDKTGAFLGVLYIVTSLYLIFGYKLIFDYTRWLFPYLTLKEYPRHLQTLHRVILATIILGIISSLIAGVL